VGHVDVINLSYEEKLSLKKRIIRRLNQFVGFYWGLSYQKVKYIIGIARQYDYIFIDTSSYGVIAYYLKKSGYSGRIICHFHNIEYIIQCQKTRSNPLNFYKILLLHYNEKKACSYSDRLVALNKRDNISLERLYGVDSVKIIPISLPDKVFELLREHESNMTSQPPTFIFIGNNWYANIHGLKWFINNVLDYVDIKLQIVGSDMEPLRKNFIHPKIEFLGFVPDLSIVLFAADYVISPIFKGSGMKVKICESLMYGKNIIGTREAFSGYELEFERVGAVCNNKDEFINFINSKCYRIIKRFNAYSRQMFLEKYSFQATLGKFNELINEL
jgi:glycosyltransferase involved in cell wall biosynthesis